MNIRSHLSRHSTQAGGALIITLIFCSLIAMVLVAYLSMVSYQHRFTHRAQVWNNCIPLCEAGLEEAMAHMNYIGTTSNFAINGWAFYSGAYRKERSLNEGFVRMAIDTANPPVITVNGFLRTPVSSNYLTRTVRVKTKVNYRFPYAVLGKGAVTLNSSGAFIDSFDSSDPTKSTAGQYDPAKRTDQAVVATSSKTAGSLNLGSLDIYGKIGTGPGGTPSLGSGSIGSTAWVDNPANDGQIEPGHATDDVNLYVPDVTMPSPFMGVPPTPGIVNGVLYDYVLLNGDYQLASMVGQLKVIVVGKARLYISGATTIGNSGSINVETGGSLEFYAGGNIDIKGTVNNPGFAKDLTFLGMNTCTAVSINAGADFACSVYAPRAAVTITGNSDGAGAIVGATIKMSGGMNWHYDEALRGDPREGRFVAASWLEL